MTALQYAVDHFDRFIEELSALLRIPSISTMPESAPDVRRAAAWCADHLGALGFDARIYETPGHPIVYGQWLEAGSDAPTLLVYGHYDVQPPDPLDLWDSPPFAPEIRDGKLYARGASDDKGQFFVHLKAAEALLKAEGALPVNLKIILEGEEESGSIAIEPFVTAHRDLLAADAIVVSDTHARSLDQPSIIYGLRGNTYMEVEVTGPDHDLHSGTYGGVVHNPAQGLIAMIAGLHDANGTVTIPGFYDTVRPLDDNERAELAKHPTTEEALRAETGIPASWGEAEYALHERTGARPTLEVNGFLSGYTGPGAKTIIPAKAMAKISCRLVPDQDSRAIYELVRDHLQSITPPALRTTVRLIHTGQPAITDRHSAAAAAAARAYRQGWGAAPIFTREGGSIPIVAHFQKVLGVPVVMMGFGLPDDALHSPNEKFSLECFRRGIATAIHFYQEVAK